MWKHTPQVNRNYAWENFMTGNQVLFMDPYVVYYPREKRNVCVSPTNAICSGPDARYDNFRDNLGYILRYSRKVNLASVTPHSALCSTGYCLAQTPSVGAEYLVYAPSGGSFTVNLSAMSGVKKIGGRVVQPVDRCGDHRRSDSRRIVLANVQSAVQRRRGALSGRLCRETGGCLLNGRNCRRSPQKARGPALRKRVISGGMG